MSREEKKRNYSNGVLGILIVLLLVQASFLWISLRNRPQKPQEALRVDEFYQEILMPQKLVLNYGQGDHTLRYHFSDIWKQTSSQIAEILSDATPEDLRPMTAEEFMSALQAPSIVYQYNGPLSGSILINLLDRQNKMPNRINIPLDSVYVAKDGSVCLAGGSDYYRLLNVKSKIPVGEILESNRHLDTKYLTFDEMFQIKRDLYLPKYDAVQLEKITYTSGLLNLDKRVKNNLAERFLGVPIDLIREIYQMDKVNYVYENKFLSLNEDGTISYSNEDDFLVEDRNLYKSLNQAMLFISSKTGMTAQMYLEKVVPVEYKKNLGYRFYFNVKENSVPVVPLRKDQSYIEIEVYSDYVKSYKEIYRKKVEDPFYRREYVKMTPLYNILSANLKLFNQATPEDVLHGISYLSIVYLDNVKAENAPLEMALEVTYHDEWYYFDLQTGKMIMKR